MAWSSSASDSCIFLHRDYQQIWRVSSGLEAGMVGVNDVAISTPEAPFGGKQREDSG
jgi:succinate-semialdehyde dehydrogenase/glutarate-semialdehyde dehydrogenase